MFTTSWRAKVHFLEENILILSVFRPGNLPRGVPEVDDGGARRDQELEGETRNTQFRQVRAAMCVIPYVMYVMCSLFDCMIVWRGPCPALYCTGVGLQVG